ncbi:MAG: hypothetical protein A3F92_16000 [Candidatus Rokubacteria bacterium RIFCSPLOWO2_12_FULL_71_22]|nr:MAG: hypothetical protein A3F92_16000 [Candidatus Rokubacteria bacterium RIFCSPLOWO2_12_FULL_71_22]
MARVLRIDHVAVAVRDVDAGIATWQKLLGAELVARERLTLQGTPTDAAYLRVGDGLVVLDGAADPGGFIAKFIERRGEGLHHLAVAVDDLDAYVRALEAEGVRIPHRESLGPLRREILLSPKDLNGVVVQVIEWTEPDAPSLEARVARLRRFLGSQRGAQ